MRVQFQQHAVHLIEGGLPEHVLKHLEAIEVRFVIPLDKTVLKVGPIKNVALRQPVHAVPLLNQLNQGFRTVQKAG